MSDPFIGEIRLLAYKTRIPAGWLLCNGQTLTVSNYETLYSLIGATYGSTASTNFCLPNLNGTLPVGMGSGTGLTPRTIGNRGGSETVTVDLGQLPTHTHVLQATQASDASGTLGPTVTFGSDTSNSNKHYTSPIPTNPAPTYTQLADTAVANNTPAGGAHPNFMPGLGLYYFICFNGIYPTRT